ncbi:hypothetical protein LCGC14_0418050 [marine sediment metagenome]|uniref:HK97 gp10 family phage protein n=1 Tax=marine sediment metagenome TaxID=412755 RepID=A0A0F9SXS1_9ZZZZ
MPRSTRLMANITIQIKGLKELKVAMVRAPQIINKEVGRGIDQALVILQRRALIEATIEPRVKTGRLRSSHTIERDRGRLQGSIGTRVFYAKFLHEGTRFMRARPWLNRAAKKEKSSIERVIQRSVNRALRRVF